jgi:hypothetical protein
MMNGFSWITNRKKSRVSFIYRSRAAVHRRGAGLPNLLTFASHVCGGRVNAALFARCSANRLHRKKCLENRAKVSLRASALQSC